MIAITSALRGTKRDNGVLVAVADAEPGVTDAAGAAVSDPAGRMVFCAVTVAPVKSVVVVAVTAAFPVADPIGWTIISSKVQ